MKEFLEQNNLEMLSEHELRQISPLKLAYVGDAIYESYVRVYIINKVKGTVNQLHKLAVKYVNASAQANITKGLDGFLTEEEKAVIKRGRNQKSGTVPKNASVTDYRLATGFESLIGYLFMAGEVQRLEQIVAKGIQFLEGETHEAI